MSTEPLNTVPLQQFIKQVQSADSSRSQELRLPIEQAKALSYTLGIVLARLNGDMEKYIKENSGGSSDDVIQVQIGSSSDWQ
jgi:hypothetical protein